MNVVEKVQQDGCSVYSLNGFPGDGDDAYTKQQMTALETQLRNSGKKRGYILSVNGFQKNAKELLEKHGFKIIAVTHTAHIDWNEARIKTWKKEYAKGVMNRNTIYLMGRGFWAPKRKKKGA